jgi:hypothetical protein
MRELGSAAVEHALTGHDPGRSDRRRHWEVGDQLEPKQWPLVLRLSGARHVMVGQYRQIGKPRSHRLPILLGHDPCDLGHVPQVVHHLGCQQLAKGDAPKARMDARQVELGGGQPP